MKKWAFHRTKERPLLGIVSRFADQKGFDLVAEIAGPLAEQNVALAVLGSGDRRFEDMFRHFNWQRPDKIGVRIGYDEGLAHRIEAGCDMFLMPSRYEPCGLNQIYSLRYGTIPIVRATGGLDDTVDAETGFKFGEYSAGAFAGAIGEALHAFQSRDAWDGAHAARDGQGFFVGGFCGRVPEDVRRACISVGTSCIISIEHKRTKLWLAITR